MKKLLLAMLLSCSIVQAEEVGRMPNKGGGYIVLVSEKCNDTSMMAYTFVSSGSVVVGCWSVLNREILVRWNDGDTKIYNPDGLVLSDWFKQFMAKGRIGS